MIELLQSSLPALLIVATLFGLIIGSFLNVVIYRLPLMMEARWQMESRAMLELETDGNSVPTFNLLTPNSRCPQCEQAIRWYQNIPLFSWLLLRGRCHHCSKPISPRYPLVELTAAALAVLCAWQFGASWWFIATLGFSWALLVLTLIDYDTTLLPDIITLPLLWAGLLLAALQVSPVSLNDALFGAAGGYLTLWSVFWLFKLFTGKEGMGYGDFKLLAALGAWLGWQLLPLVLLLSSLVGAIIGGALLASGIIKRDQGIPFGPYLAIAGLIALFLGNDIVTSWLQIMGP